MTLQKLLTVDADWALNPTPLQLISALGDEPRATLEADLYDFALSRPANGRHQITDPALLTAEFYARGLSRKMARKVTVTPDHHQILKLIGAETVDHIICLDAHLDIYGVLTFDLNLRDPGKIVRHLGVNSVFNHTILRDLDVDPAQAKDLFGSQPVQAIEESFRLSAWLLWVSQQNIRRQKPSLRVDWVVPLHFLEALKHGFPYPNAQWYTTLDVGDKRGLWTYQLFPTERKIHLTPYWGGAIDIYLMALSEVDLGNCALVHICSSPRNTPPEMDPWAATLARKLC